MSRFTAKEKEHIRQRLLTEGEWLFIRHGLKKVTIDDLAAAAGIAKATFYSFYGSKEALYLDIVRTAQQTIFRILDQVLTDTADCPNRERVRRVFETMPQLLTQYPILSQINQATVKSLTQKLTDDELTAYTRQNVDAVQVLVDHGVKFSCDTTTAASLFQTLYNSWLFLQNQGASTQAAVTGILLTGVIDQIVVD